MLMHRRETLPTRCSRRWRFGTAAACSLALAGAVALCGVPPAAAQSTSDDSKPATSQTVRPVTPVVKNLDATPVAEVLKARLQDVLQRATELKGEATKAQEDDKSVQEQIYRAQLQKVEAERAAVEAELQQLRKSEAAATKAAKTTAQTGTAQSWNAQTGTAQTGTAQSGTAQSGTAPREREALERVREELAVSQKMLAEMMSRSHRQLDGSLAEVDALKRELAELRSRLSDQQNRMKSADLDRAKMLGDLRKREAEITRSEAEARQRMSALDQAKHQLAVRSSSAAGAADAFSGRDTAAGSGETAARDAAVRDAAVRSAAVPGESGGAKLSAGSLDLVALATSYADAVGSVRVARFRVKAAAEKDQGTEEEIQRASLQTAEHKAGLLRSIAEIALAGAEAEYKQVRQLVDQGVMSTSKLTEAEAKLKILHVILQSDGQGDGAKRDGDKSSGGNTSSSAGRQ